MAASKLIKDLTHVPEIVGGMGLSIAEAQKLLNHDYLNSIQRILGMTKMMLGEVKGDKDGKAEDASGADLEKLQKLSSIFRDLLTAIAPPRYQFTETTLNVKLDLAQSMDATVTAGIGFGMGAVSINAAFTVGYAYDYRAAAEVRTVIHAIPADPLSFAKLLDRAKDLDSKVLDLPEDAAEVDKALFDKQVAVLENSTGIKAATLPAGE